jgi:hypothetical protein
MVIRGTIVHVRETWPLQLVVDTRQGHCEVTLRDETTVVRGGVDVDPGELRPGQAVDVSGNGDASSITATAITIA